MIQIREVNMARILNACTPSAQQELYEGLFREATAELSVFEAEDFRINLSILYAQFMVDLFLKHIKRIRP